MLCLLPGLSRGASCFVLYYFAVYIKTAHQNTMKLIQEINYGPIFHVECECNSRDTGASVLSGILACVVHSPSASQYFKI